jgi:hypothetical protein
VSTTSAPTSPAVPQRSAARSARRARATAWRWTAAAAVGAAGVAHLITSAGHLDDGQLVIAFFLVTAFAQLGAAVWLAAGTLHRGRPAPRVVLLAIAGTVALIGVYLVAHLTTWLGDLAGTSAPVSVHDHSGAATDPFAAGHASSFDGSVPLAGKEGPQPEPVTLLGTLTVAAEVVAIAALSALLPARWRSRVLNGLLGLGALVWVLWLTGVLS